MAKKELIHIADMITASNLNWTIVRFMAPKDTPFIGNVKVGFGDTKMNFNISREDIGSFMVEQLNAIAMNTQCQLLVVKLTDNLMAGRVLYNSSSH